MDEFSRPATLEDLKLLLRSLYDRDVSDRVIIERALEVFRARSGRDDDNHGGEP